MSGNSCRWRCGRIGDYRAGYLGKRSQFVYLNASRAVNFLGAYAVDHECVGDERAMTAPRHGLGAHQRNSFARGLLDEASQIFSKLRSLHVIGETAEGNVSPAHIQRPRVRAAEAPQAGNMRIANAGDLQCGR